MGWTSGFTIITTIIPTINNAQIEMIKTMSELSFAHSQKPYLLLPFILFTYFTVLVDLLVSSYTGLKLLVDVIGIFPTPSKMIVTIITTMFSYFSQKKYTFRGVKDKK